MVADYVQEIHKNELLIKRVYRKDLRANFSRVYKQVCRRYIAQRS